MQPPSPDRLMTHAALPREAPAISMVFAESPLAHRPPSHLGKIAFVFVRLQVRCRRIGEPFRCPPGSDLLMSVLCALAQLSWADRSVGTGSVTTLRDTPSSALLLYRFGLPWG